MKETNRISFLNGKDEAIVSRHGHLDDKTMKKCKEVVIIKNKDGSYF